MYTKISHGNNFLGAALYDAQGLSKAQQQAKAGKVELVHTENLLSRDAHGIAAEMSLVASFSKAHKPCWNIAMSAPVGITLSSAQWRAAAEQNLTGLGVELSRYQYAIYRHADTSQDHIHILLNSVPVDGGPALSRQFKAVAAQKQAAAIDQALGLVPVKAESIRDTIAQRLTQALSRRPTSVDELTDDLAQAGLVVGYAQNSRGIYGVTFQLSGRDHQPVKGSAIPLDGQQAKWNVIAALLEANRRAYEAEIERLTEELQETKNTLTDQQEEIKEVYEKRDSFRNAYYELNYQYNQLQREVTPARNKPHSPPVPQVIEKLVKDPADQQRIAELEQENTFLKEQLKQARSLQSAPVATAAAPGWHTQLREVLKRAVKPPFLRHNGYQYSEVKQLGKVVDLKIYRAGKDSNEAVLLSKFAPDSKLLASFRHQHRLK